ncbi:hypothetical protein C8Q80DRAFT_1098403 [Daedaleopsis nitida]|nr:hypothetical protein C8Q80DRAFT_1098403 [Daedaleopsis nitida]
MLEPLATTVLTILPSRPLATHLFTSKSSFGMAARSAKHALPSDFFTPHPRTVQGKGKGRAAPEDEYGACSGSSDTYHTRSYVAVVEHVNPSMTKFCSTRPRTRRSSAHKPVAPTTHIPSLRTWMRQVDVVQRRHASSRAAVELSRHPPTPPDERHLWHTTVRRVADGADDFSAEDAWSAYQGLCKCYGEPLGPASLAITFLDKLALSVANGRQGEVTASLLRLWGARIHDALHQIDPGIVDMPRNTVRVHWNCVRISSSAMTGKLDEVLEDVHLMFHLCDSISEPRTVDRHLSSVLPLYAITIQALRQYRGVAAVFDFLVQESYSLRAHLYDPSSPTLSRPARLLSSVALSVLATMETPTRSLQSLFSVWSKKRVALAGLLLVRAMCFGRRQKDACAVIRLMQGESLKVPLRATIALIRDLVKAKSFHDASAILSASSVPEGGRGFERYHSTGLFIRSRQGDIKRAEEHYQALVEHGSVTLGDKTSIMHAYAEVGKPDRVVELFNEFFSASPTSSSTEHPNIVHYTTAIFAYSRVGDLDSVNTWLGKLTEAGFRPDLHVYSIILESFASRGDVTSVTTVLDQMHSSGLRLNTVICTSIISILAKRNDPIAAERVYKRALSDGVVPDRIMVTAIMNAHVESGSWQGVIRAWDYLNTEGRVGAGLTIEVFNTLMKAYVLIGAPFRTVATLFRQLSIKQLRPDARTFALLIQSACDSGFMDIAEDLQEEMDRLVLEDDQKSLQANIYVLTIVMSGFLRQGKRVKAKAMLDKMKERGIEPTAITYAAILKAYAEQKNDQSIKAAEEFMSSLLSSSSDNWLQMHGGRRLTVEVVYRPLLNAFAHREEPAEVERLYEDMLRAGNSPTLGTLTMLMDAHRRVGNISAVETIWPEIHRLGLEFTRQNAILSPDSDQSPNLSAYGSLMCVPFSILIDALSAAGKHAEVAQTWRTLKDEKLQFDSHNWNHLVAALVRAGETQRAFDIVENVILRYQRQSRRQLERTREMHPASPLTLDLPPPEEGDLPPHRPEAPLHAPARREVAAQRATRRLRSEASSEKPGQEDEDFAHPLLILHNMSPLWNTWRPHGATLVLLGRVLDHLRSGRLVQAIRPGSDSAFEQTVVDAEEIRTRTEAAGLVLGEIYERFPETIRLVQEYELMRRTSAHRISNAAQERT